MIFIVVSMMVCAVKFFNPAITIFTPTSLTVLGDQVIL